MSKKENPVLKKKYDEGRVVGFNEGSKVGHSKGYSLGKKAGAALLAVKMERIQSIPGIGPKRIKQIFDALGPEFSDEEQKLYNKYLQDLIDRGDDEAWKN